MRVTTDIKEEPDIDLFEIDAQVSSKGYQMKVERYGFLLCKAGNLTLTMDDRVYHIHKGDLYIFPAFSNTTILAFSDDLSGIVGAADFDFIFKTLETLCITQLYAYIRFHPKVSLTDEQFREVEEMVHCLFRQKDKQSDLRMKIISSLVQTLCYEMIDAYMTNTPICLDQKDRKDKVFQEFLLQLLRSFRVHRDVAFYAEQQCLTPRYFATVVREKSGKTPLQWIAMFVLSEAKRLLSDPKLSIKEVADELNFTNQSFFGRYFRLYAGISPSEYRSKHSSPSNSLSKLTV